MRRSLFSGLILAVAAGLLVLVGAALELDIESVALLGGALGATVALVPDRTALVRLVGFAAGFVIAWIGYVMRAALLPDTSAGRAVAVVVVVLLCVAVTAAARGRLPLWSLLLGTAALTGAYEFTYADAPQELMTSSLNTATMLFLSVAVGFFAAAISGPADDHDTDVVDFDVDVAAIPGSGVTPAHDGEQNQTRLNDMMENSK